MEDDEDAHAGHDHAADDDDEVYADGLDDEPGALGLLGVSRAWERCSSAYLPLGAAARPVADPLPLLARGARAEAGADGAEGGEEDDPYADEHDEL